MASFVEIKKGSVFNRLTVVSDLGMVLNEEWSCKKKLHLLRMRCECGNEIITPLSPLNSGIIKSCGCFKRKILSKSRLTHGLSKHPLFKIHKGIIKRCYNENDPNYKNYGAKGVKVCKSWREDFLDFYNWANENNWKSGLQIDRINNNGNYEPENCRIVTPKQNCNNKSNNRILEHNVVKLNVTQWGELVGLNPRTIYARVFKYNWDIERALNTPIYDTRAI